MFSEALDDLSRVLLESFFDGIKTADDATVIEEPMEVDTEQMQGDEIDSSKQRNAAKKKGSGVVDVDEPANKKARKEENGNVQTRNLRSRSRGNNRIPLIIDQIDYVTDDEEIPECLRESDTKVVSKPPSRFDRFEHFENTIELMTYRNIPLQMEDYKCLDRRELLTNYVLNFYLQYLFHERLPAEMRERVHIYDTTFYNFLGTKSNYAAWKNDNRKAADKRYDRVKEIDKDVNIFEKDFIVFPCYNNEHWFLAIACYPRLNGAVTTDGDEPIIDEEERVRDMRNPSGGRALKASCILILDSVQNNAGRKTAAMNHIRNFFISRHRDRYRDEFAFDGAAMKMSAPRVSFIEDF